jgi:flagella basal body P-ring formation protein FlgA
MARMNPRQLLSALAAASTLYAPAAPASDRQDLSVLGRVVEQYVRKESAGLPGTVSFAVTPFDSRLSLPHCPHPEAFMAPGGRLWGKSAVGVRCNEPTAWSVYASVQVEVNAEYVVSARSLGQGETVGTQDLSVMRGDLARLPAGTIIDPSHAIGKQLALSLGAGQPLRKDMLRAPLVITQGQGVKLQTQGPGFQVSSEGRALGSAADGQSVQVRSTSGQTISGIARSGGVVEVRY